MNLETNTLVPPPRTFLARLAGAVVPHGRPVARLSHVEGHLSFEGARPVELWGRGGNLGPEFGEAGLQAALALPDNSWLLRAIAGLHVDGPLPHFLGREVGGGGGVDVAAAFAGRTPRLLLLDVKGLHPHKHDGWLAQARRIAVAALPHLHVDPTPEVRLVTLAGLNDHNPLDDHGLLEDWMGRPTIPYEAWSFVPFALPRPRPHALLDPPDHRVPPPEWDVLVLFGPNEHLRDAEPVDALRRQLAGAERYELGWASAERVLTLAGGKEWAEVRVRGGRNFVRVAVKVKPEPHRGSYHPAPEDPVARQISQLRLLATGNGLGRWRFCGEHNDKGCVRFEWEPDTALGPADDTLGSFLEALQDALPKEVR